MSLDDEVVDRDFFERKIEESKKLNLIKSSFSLQQNLTDEEF